MIDLLRIMTMPPAQRVQLAAQAEYEHDVLSLRCIVGTAMPYERFVQIVNEVAYQSPHENHLMPNHLEYLLKNRWLIEGLPETISFEQLCNQIARYPIECEFGCLKKFLALVEGEA